MISQNKFKYLFLLVVFIVAGFAMTDALGFFNPKPYIEIHHGPIIHYVPKNRDPNISIERFPMEKPLPDEMVTPKGQIIKKSEWAQWKRENTSQNTAASDSNKEKGIRTINIIGTNQMKFMVTGKQRGITTDKSLPGSSDKDYLLLKSIMAKPGERLRIRFTNITHSRPKMMSHNWVLLKKDVDPQAFVNAANRGNNYFPPNKNKDVIAHTNLAAGGETVEVTFTAADQPGRYDYLCSFMAHFAAGMRGTLIVK